MTTGTQMTPMRRPLRNRRMYIRDGVFAAVLLFAALTAVILVLRTVLV